MRKLPYTLLAALAASALAVPATAAVLRGLLTPRPNKTSA